MSVLALAAALALPAQANPEVIENARRLLNQGNAKQAYAELSKHEAQLAGNIDFDYLYGVAALDSGKIDDAIVALERVLAVNPNHAGAQMDLARTYFMAGSYDLAEAAFKQLAESNPPPVARQTINRYLEAIENRKRQTTAGWQGYVEMAIGYDSNITGVPSDFGAAAQQSFGIIGIEATGNSVERDAPFGTVAAAAEYSLPLSRGWSVFAGAEGKFRGYRGESSFNSPMGEGRAGAAFNDGPVQWRMLGSYQVFNQEGEAPGDPKPTNDRRTANLQGDWKWQYDTRSQVGASLQYVRVRFPTNPIEDFNQVMLSGSWLRSFETKGVPLVYLGAFITDDRAVNQYEDGTDKSKNLAGARSYLQYSLTPTLHLFNGLGFVYRKDKDAYARATEVEIGRDKFLEFLLGVNWQFAKSCTSRTQWVYTKNNSNIAIYDFDRNEVSTAVRCEFQ